MYKVGEKVRYKTLKIKAEMNTIEEKVGIIEEAFFTIDKKPCYWIEGEKYLILEKQIIEKIE